MELQGNPSGSTFENNDRPRSVVSELSVGTCYSARTTCSRLYLRRNIAPHLGYRTFYCGDCDKRFYERTDTPFNDLLFPTEIVLLAAPWRLRYKLGFRDVAELLLQGSFEVSYETIRVWEFRFAPLVSENLHTKWREIAGLFWYLDETFIKVGALALLA